MPFGAGYSATRTHDYRRNGTTTLFAALNVLDGRVIGVSSSVWVAAGATAPATVTALAPSGASQARTYANFSMFGMGTGASIGVLSAIIAATITTIAVVSSGDEGSTTTPTPTGTGTASASR